MDSLYTLKFASKAETERLMQLIERDFDEGIDQFHDLPASEALYRDPYASFASCVSDECSAIKIVALATPSGSQIAASQKTDTPHPA